MKINITSVILLFVLILSSCVNEIDSTAVSNYIGKNLTVRASTGELQTKTAVQSNGTSIYWTPGDAINVFYGSGSAGKFTATSMNAPNSYAEFNGTISVVTGSNETGGGSRMFWGVYPYNESNTCDGSSITMTIPSSQAASAETFANNLNPTVSCSPGLDMVFYNVGSWFIFSVTQEGVVSATLTGNNDEDLVGKVKVTMDSNNRPACTILEGEKSITMDAPEGGFVPGVLYYMVLIPQTLEQGYTLTLKKSNAQASCVISTPAQFTRSYYRRKKNADDGLTYTPLGGAIPPNNEIWYKTDTGTAITLRTSVNFGAPIVSNTYEEGVGIIKCESDITSISAYTFYNESITELFLPASVQEIGDGAFRYNNITTVTIPNKVNTIGGGAFEDCQNLSSIIVEAINPPLGSTNMFKRTNAATIYVSAESVEAYKSSPYWEEYAYRIQAMTDDPNIIVFADNKVKEICIAKWDTDGDGELSLEEAASVTDLKSAFHNSEIEYFDEFRFFTGIQTMGVLTSDGTGYMENGNFFYNCSKLKSIRLPRSITKLGGGAFDQCASLKEIEIPFAIDITCGPFYGCESLESFIDVNGERSHVLCTKPYNNKRSLASIAPAGITRLEISTLFGGAANIYRVLSRALYSWKTLEPLSIILHTDALQRIEDSAFSNTPGLSVSLDIESEDSYATSALLYIGPFAFCATGIQSFSIPENVSTIGESCFKNCTELRSFYFGSKKLKTIPREVFYNCTALQTISIPESVSSIATDAFANCTSLTTIYLNSTTPPTLSGTPFRGTTCVFSVPNNVLNTYINHAQWQEYSSRIVGR